MAIKSNQGCFQIATPVNWNYPRLNWIDSYIGEIVDREKDTPFFDMRLDSEPLDHPRYRTKDNEDDDYEKYKSKVSYRIINGYPAKFTSHCRKTNSDYWVFFGSLWTLNDSNDWPDIMKFLFMGLI